uniref:PIPK domain-containing protein n=1 Tax=Globisporangium ultimum (strain ATCC 200006 / CBS 805.95 / DAOM BR144) TaxID=431595 RepID=K3WQW3_GLOUD
MVSVASLVGCVYVIVSYLYIRALRQHPAGIMFGMSIYGAIYQFLYLLDRSSESIQCSQMGVFVDFFLTGQETYMLIFAIDLLLALQNPFSASKGQMKKYHIGGGLWSLVCATISHFDTHYALFGFCWMSSSDDHLIWVRGFSDTSTGTVPPAGEAVSNGTITSGIFFALYIVVVYCTSLVAILCTWNRFSKGLPDTFKTRQRIHRHLKYYVGCYFGYWTLVLGCYALFSLMPRENTDGKGGVRCRIWHLLKCLLLAKGMVNSLIWTRTSNILTIIEQLREFGYVDLPAHEDSINWALRLEILTKTTRGICESIDYAEHEARASGVLSPTSSAEDLGHCISNLDSEFCERKESYAQIRTIILETRNDRRARGPMSEGVVFYDFAPHVFRRLRGEARISSSSYRNSLQQTTKERVSEGKSGAFFYFTEDRKYVVKTLTKEELKFLLSILPTYYTFIKNNPNTFMTRFFGCHGLTMYGKTVFFMVMQSVFDSNLQIHERFDLKGSWVGRLEGRKPSGTIATCKFCSVEFVVGGSHDQLCGVRRGEGNLRHQYDQVGKDLNWNRHMALPFLTARAVAVQLTKDSNFLCKINCIDYSLLVGIHHRSFNVSHYSSADNFEHPPRGSSGSIGGVSRDRASSGGGGFDPTMKPFHQAIQGGMSVDEVHGPGIYFMGLIDILQQWNLRKRVEHFVRVYIFMQDKNGVSVVNPRQYADRFQQRVIRELIYDGNLEMDEVEMMQLQFQEPCNMQLMESGFTRSTMIESFNTRCDSTAMLERMSSFLTPPQMTTPIMPMRFSARMASSGVSSAAARSSSQRQRAATVSTGLPEHYSLGPRFSGGLVMEPPRGFYAPQPNNSVQQPPAYLPPPLSSSSSYPLPSYVEMSSTNVRQPLAPVTPSPRVSCVTFSRSDSEASLLRFDRSLSSVVPISSSAPPPPTSMTIETHMTEPHHLTSLDSYRIVRTPTLTPDKLPTLSA